MFVVINKEKLYAYIVSIITVIMLFCMANFIIQDTKTLETSANTNNQTTENEFVLP